MLDFKLSLQQNATINKWLTNKDKPLLIYGKDGVGKTSLAKHILREHHIIYISNEFIKYKYNIVEYFNNNLITHNVLMMTGSKNIYKALIIDDIHIYEKQDKSTMIKIINYLQKLNSNIRVILINDELKY